MTLSEKVRYLRFNLIQENWIFLFEAYRLTSITTATLAYYMVPVILILLSPLILKERVGLTKWICVICALIGMSLIGSLHWQKISNSITNQCFELLLFSFLNSLLGSDRNKIL